MTDPPDPPRRPWRFWIGLLFLNLLAAARYAWEDATLFDWFRISPDLVLLLAVGFFSVLCFGYRVLVGHLLAIGVLLVPIYRFGHTLMPLHYHEFDPYNDVLMLPSLVHLLTHEMTSLQRILALLAAAIATVALYVAVWFAARAVLRVRRTTAVGALCACQLVVVAALFEASARPAAASGFLAPGMYAEILRDARDTVGRWRLLQTFGEWIRLAEDKRAGIGTDLAGLQGADVHVLFIESYGRAVFRNPRDAATHSDWQAELGPQLAAAGFRVCSAFCSPSVSGGLSSAAHAELLTGVPVANRRMLDRLLGSDLKALPKYFNEAGYFTFQVQPATTEQWPEGRFYGFQEDVFADSLPYEGVTFHWGRMPDQFALNHVLRTRLLPCERPVFMMYVSVSSHAPFRAVPPYYADWSRASEPGAYDAPARTYPIGWIDFANHPRLTEAYMDCLHYSLQTVVGFAAQLERPSLLIVLGDHQPPAAGDLRVNDTTRHVPMHAIANRDELLLPFVAHGFVEGLRPDDDLPPFPTAEVVYAFLGAFSTPPEDEKR